MRSALSQTSQGFVLGGNPPRPATLQSRHCQTRARDRPRASCRSNDGQAVAPAGAFQTVSAGGLHSCGLRADNTIPAGAPTTMGRLLRLRDRR